MAHGSAEGAEDCGKGLLYCVGDLVIGAAGVLGEWRGGGGEGAGSSPAQGGMGTPPQHDPGPALWPDTARMVPARRRRLVCHRLGPAPPLPGLPPPAPHAHRDRLLGLYAATRPAAYRIHLSLRPRNPEGRRIANLRPDQPRMDAPFRRHLGRTMHSG